MAPSHLPHSLMEVRSSAHAPCLRQVKATPVHSLTEKSAQLNGDLALGGCCLVHGGMGSAMRMCCSQVGDVALGGHAHCFSCHCVRLHCAAVSVRHLCFSSRAVCAAHDWHHPQGACGATRWQGSMTMKCPDGSRSAALVHSWRLTDLL